MTVPALPVGPAWLFCPGNRPDRFAEAVAAADSVILDLEDAVPPDDRALARREVAAAVAGLDPARTIVRVNSLDGQGLDDLAALDGTALRNVMVPKAEDGRRLAGLTGWNVVALCETAEGLLRIDELARGRPVVALGWGGEDLTADLGGRRGRGLDQRPLPQVSYLRVSTLVAARARRVAPVDGVWTDLSDDDGLRLEAREAAWMGFQSKLCVHPRQVAVIREAFAPGDDDVDRARRQPPLAGA